jgi:thymidylate kinase
MEDTLLIAFEGNDRAGKDTLIDKVYNNLKAENIDVRKYRNPDFPFRDFLLNSNLTDLENFVIFWTGYYNIHKRIETDKPKVALINRHYISGLVYQRFLENHIDISKLVSMQRCLPLPILHTIFYLSISKDEFENRFEKLKTDGSVFENNKNEMIQRFSDYKNIIEIIKNYLSFNELNLQQEIISLSNNTEIEFDFNVDFIFRKIKTQLKI